MNSGPRRDTGPNQARRIELNLSTVNQLFNTMDPSPFNERDLDREAEEFILGWAREFPLRDPIELVVHLNEPPKEDAQRTVTQAVHHYFQYRARLNRLDFRRLMREGWRALVIGMLFLGACLAAAEALGKESGGPLMLVRESLVIGGWVAMWRPMEICLYEWWPLRRRGLVFEKLSRMPVTVKVRAA